MKAFLSFTLGFLCTCAALTAEAQVKWNRNDNKFLNSVTNGDTSRVYASAVKYQNLSFGGTYVDGITINGLTTKEAGTLSLGISVRERTNPNAGYTAISGATASIGDATTPFTIKLPAGTYWDIQVVLTGSTGTSVTKTFAAPWIIRR